MKKRILLLILAVFAATAAFFGFLRWRSIKNAGTVTAAEIVRNSGGSVLAAKVGSDGLFTFGIDGANILDADGNSAAPETLVPGTLIRIAGPDNWLETYPEQYPSVTEIRVTGSREDFVVKHLETLLKECEGLSDEKIREKVGALDDLTSGEQESLVYLAECSLGIFGK